MPTLLITLAGPQQAWGSKSRFSTRTSEHAPTRSGVIGMLAGALGLERTAPLDRFDQIEFGVRVDQPGRVERDYQTATALEGGTTMSLSRRYYLADAVFLAALGSADESQLAEWFAALRAPKFPLYLGRRAFPPAGPLRCEIVDTSVRDALFAAPWQASAWFKRQHDGQHTRLDVFVDAHPGEDEDFVLRDIPRSYDPRRRVHDVRGVRALATSGAAAHCDVTQHDPMSLVSDEEV